MLSNDVKSLFLQKPEDIMRYRYITEAGRNDTCLFNSPQTSRIALHAGLMDAYPMMKRMNCCMLLHRSLEHYHTTAHFRQILQPRYSSG